MAVPDPNVHQDPQTGLYVNTVTGAVSQDPYGQQAATNPSLANLASRNVSVSNQLLAGSGAYNQQYNGAQQGQGQLVNSLGAMIAGTAPSAAQSQLGESTGQIIQQQQSQASGATGENAAIAKVTAMQDTGQAQAQAAQQAALIRATETAQARAEQGQVLGQQATEAGQMYITNVAGSTANSGQAGGEAASAQQSADARNAANKAFWSSIINAGGGGATALAGGGGKPPSSNSNPSSNPYADEGDGTGSGSYSAVGD